MSDIQNFGSFIAAILIFQAVPGPGTVAILNATARNGVRAGMGAVLGTLTGDLAYMLAAVLGLAAVMAANPTLFAAMQYLGAAYLAWMGWCLWRSRADAAAPGETPRQNGWAFFRQALAVALTNPKVVLFFLAFFPLFLRPDASPTTLAAMMAWVTGISLLWQTGLVLIGNWVARRLAGQAWARRAATRLAGVALMAFGLRLALDQR